MKDVFLPWYNAYRFLVQNAKRLDVEGFAPFTPLDLSILQKSPNVLDRWISSASQSLVLFVRQEMEAYRLYTVSVDCFKVLLIVAYVTLGDVCNCVIVSCSRWCHVF